MQSLPNESIDLIACDLPYGTTHCKWDSIIPLPALWEQYRRLIKPRGCIVLNAAMPFTATLYNSNPKWFLYDLLWDKVSVTGHLDCKRKPLRSHESLLIFSPIRRPTYNPQMIRGKPHTLGGCTTLSECYGDYKAIPKSAATDEYYPKSILRIPSEKQSSKQHPTQKPVALAEWIIRTYSNPGETVLDNTMGSGTTGCAAINTGRNFFGIEKDDEYCSIAQKRIDEATLRNK
jgi:hypothetical protein